MDRTTTRYDPDVILIRVFFCLLCILGFLAGLALFRLHDLGLPLWPLVREALLVGTFVGLLTPPLTKLLRNLFKG